MSAKELEERVMIDKKQFLKIEKYILDNYKEAKILHIKNRYLDDANSNIRGNHNVLRIRSFKNNPSREFTYKIKGDDGDIEYTTILSQYWFYQITRFSRIPEGETKEALLKNGIDISSLRTLVELFTRRIEVELDDHILVLDSNMYNEIVDFDLEIESKISTEHAKETILKYCEMFSLEYKKDYIVKSRRAFLSLKK